MKKVILALVALSLVATTAEAKKKKKSKEKDVVPVQVFTNSVDSMSYALGLSLGNDFGQNIKSIPGGKSNLDLLVLGFQTALKGDSTLMPLEFASEYFRNYMMAEQQKEGNEKKAVGEDFLVENAKKEGIFTTASGLQYQIITPAEGAKPNATDRVKVHYEGFLLNGTKFDSSVDRGEPIDFALNQVIPGWSEGVQLMPVGSKYKLFIPYNLGYGEQGAGGVIPPYSTLIFDVELIEILPELPQLDVQMEQMQ